ncbi:MAG TPA: hypothetical protein VNA25_09430 [Phycisphaerae bacterium]|nr:hypothetical protein [Phycisphaerae bacterium]
MHSLTENCQVVQLANETKNDGAPTTTYADCAGYNHATFILGLGVTDTTVDAKLQESDASGSGYADITGAAITQLSGTDDDSVAAIEVDLTGPRKRYLKPVITVGAGSSGAALGAYMVLSRADAAPPALVAAGLSKLVERVFV